MVSVWSGEPICAPPHLSVSLVLPLKQFQFSSDWRWPALILLRKIVEHFLRCCVRLESGHIMLMLQMEYHAQCQVWIKSVWWCCRWNSAHDGGAWQLPPPACLPHFLQRCSPSHDVRHTPTHFGGCLAVFRGSLGCGFYILLEGWEDLIACCQHFETRSKHKILEMLF